MTNRKKSKQLKRYCLSLKIKSYYNTCCMRSIKPICTCDFYFSKIDFGLCWCVHARLQVSSDMECIICHMKPITDIIFHQIIKTIHYGSETIFLLYPKIWLPHPENIRKWEKLKKVKFWKPENNSIVFWTSSKPE